MPDSTGRRAGAASANHARSQRRREALARVFLDQVGRAHVDPADVEHDVLRAIAALGPDDREALILVGWDGLRPAEAATVLGCATPDLPARTAPARQ